MLPLLSLLHGAPARAAAARGEMAVGAVVVAPGCVVSLGAQGGVAASCGGNPVIRQEPLPALVPTPRDAGAAAGRRLVTVMY